jgi:SAM-dependent methyltransferase
MGTAIVQGQLWGVRAKDWAEVQEVLYTPLFEAVLRKTALGPGLSVLDIGCGSGLFCQMAMLLGAQVSGLDASQALLDIARQRAPHGDFRLGEMEELPYADQTFDVVAGFNSFQFAADPVNALAEARRVARQGGSLVIAVFGKPEDTEATAYFTALRPLLPPPPPGAPGPFALSLDGALERLVAQAGMTPAAVEQIDCPWQYADEETLLRALLSTAPSIRAIQNSGEAAVRQAILVGLASFKTASGGYHLKNNTHYMIVKT